MTFKGIFPALITPYHKDGSVHEQSLRKIVALNLDKGVQGFFVGGTAGEGLLLSMEERKQVMQIVADATYGSCTLIAHIGAISTDQCIDLGKSAKSMGYDAVSAIPPIYYKYSNKELHQFYYDLVENTELPMILYNYPLLTGVAFTADFTKDLLKEQRIIGIKNTTPDPFEVERMKAYRPDFYVYSGIDGVFLGNLAMGADGCIGSSLSVMSEHFILLQQHFNRNDLVSAMAIQKKLNNILELTRKFGVINSVKTLLEHQGIECGIARKPFLPLSQEQQDQLITAFNKIS